MVTIGVLDPEQHDRLQRLRELVADGVVNAQAVDFLLARDALPRLVRELPQAIDAKSLEAWQVAGLFLVRGGRAYDGIAVFEALYEMLLERQVTDGARIHKGMPLVWIRDAHVNLDHTALAQRFIMLTLIEDAIYSNGEIDPYTTGSYFRLVWYHGMSDKQFRQYARDSADFARSNELATRYPERVLQELDQLWMTAFPSTAEALLYPANRRYVAELLKMAGGFAKALVNANWTAGPSMSQTQIYTSVVAGQPRPVVYFLVDAMRFEMGVELAERLPKAAEVGVRHAVGVLPSITSIGMAALQPGASASFTVVEQGGKLGARIEDAFLPDLAARKKFAAARVANLTDMTLDELLSLTPSKLTKRIEGAQVIVVRSQEIDHAGEAGFTFQARQVMDTVIDNLARAIRKLAVAGVEHSVVSADHGHLFFASDRDESMRTDAPGGNQVELHRRCWIGRGGATPPVCLRVGASALGYASDLEFVFPSGCGVFTAGGDLAFHHGGPSLQELILPVLTIRMKTPESARPTASPVTVTGSPEVVTNRIFSVTLQLGGQNLSLFANALVVRALLISSAGKQVGAVGMAIDAEVDRHTCW